MTITFCGHSVFYATEEHEQRIMTILKEKIGEEVADIYRGGYGAFDEFAYNCCKKFKEINPKVSLFFVTPYMTEEYQKNNLREKEKLYDGIVYPEIEDKPLRFAITYRNKWMADKCDFLICAVAHKWGGAYKTYQYAKQKGKEIINILNL